MSNNCKIFCFVLLIDFGQTELVSNKKNKQFFRVNVTTNTSDTDSHTGTVNTVAEDM